MKIAAASLLGRRRRRLEQQAGDRCIGQTASPALVRRLSGEVVSYTSLPTAPSSAAAATEPKSSSFASESQSCHRQARRMARSLRASDAAQEQSPGQNKARASPSPTRQRSGPEVYLADGVDKLRKRVPSRIQQALHQARSSQAKPYRWTSDDGTSVEGWLMYPPGKFEAKNLPMFVSFTVARKTPTATTRGRLVSMDRLAATPDGSSSSPTIADRPATATSSRSRSSLKCFASRQDILTGVDALVKDGIADANHLTSAATATADT